MNLRQQILIENSLKILKRDGACSGISCRACPVTELNGNIINTESCASNAAMAAASKFLNVLIYQII